MSWLKARFLAYGALLGTAGVKILSSQDAKKGIHKCHCRCTKRQG